MGYISIMTDEQQKPEEAPVETVTEVVEAVEVDDYQPPVTGQEFRETISDATEYIKEAWLQPFRRVVREGLDAGRSFARDLAGKQRKQ